jgi:hypothetical protein
MDPNTALTELREKLDRLGSILDHDERLPEDREKIESLTSRVVDLFDGLDEWVKTGGALPDEWLKFYVHKSVLSDEVEDREIRHENGVPETLHTLSAHGFDLLELKEPRPYWGAKGVEKLEAERVGVSVTRRTDDEQTISFDAPGFTTVRACMGCGTLIAGGPSRCSFCTR